MYRVKIRDFWFADNDTGLPVDFHSWAAAYAVVLASLNLSIPAKVVKQKEVSDG